MVREKHIGVKKHIVFFFDVKRQFVWSHPCVYFHRFKIEIADKNIQFLSNAKEVCVISK